MDVTDQHDRLPYKQRVICSRCGEESLVESAVGGVS